MRWTASRGICWNTARRTDRARLTEKGQPKMEQNKMEGRACPPQFAVPKNQEKPPFFVSGAEKLAALCSYPLAWLYVRGYALGGAHWKEGLDAFTLLFCLGVELFSRSRARTSSPPGLFFGPCCG